MRLLMVLKRRPRRFTSPSGGLDVGPQYGCHLPFKGEDSDL
jgi:hypothetical protein